MSKFPLINSFVASPGNCSSCGSSTGPAIDTGLSFDFYGAVVFCLLCAKDLGRSAGLIDEPPVAEVITNEVVITEEQLNGYLADARAGADLFISIIDRIESVLHSMENSGIEKPAPEITDDSTSSSDEQNDNTSLSKGSVSLPDSSSNAFGNFQLS